MIGIELKSIILLIIINPLIYHYYIENNYIPTSQNPTIQEMIDNSNENDTIFVNNGKYYERIIINKSITLIGNNIKNVEIINNNSAPIIVINSNNVIIKNISFSNSFDGLLIYGNNINIEKCSFNNFSNCSITSLRNSNISINNCNFFNNYNSFFSERSNKITIKNSIIKNGTYGLGFFYSTTMELFNNSLINIINNGIFYYYSNDNLINNNNILNSKGIGIANYFGYINVTNTYINNCSKGIDIGSCLDFWTSISNTSVENCTECGIEIWQSNTHIKNLKIINNTYGLKISGNINKGNILMENIKILNNLNGIYVYYSNHISISNCSLSLNKKYGINMVNAMDNMIFNNTFTNNSLGINLLNTNNNQITGNDFVNNKKSAKSNGNDIWTLPYPTGGNYWSDYNGKDRKKGAQQNIDGSDGFGDTTYYINGSLIRDQYPIFRDIIPPDANAGYDVIINQGQIYHFDGSRSIDDQLIHKVVWEWYYNSEYYTINEIEFDFIFNIPGEFIAYLTAFDFAGNFNSDSINISVVDVQAPRIDCQGNITILQGEIAYFNASNAKDEGGIRNYSWSFHYDNELYTLYDETNQFIFYKPGIFEVTLRIEDFNENYALMKFFVTVRDIENPIAIAGPDTIINNWESAFFNGTDSTDNGFIMNYTWSFNYNETEIVLEGIKQSYFFIIPGYYEINLTVKDQFGNCDIDQVMVTVVDTIHPYAAINGTLIQGIGESIKLDGLLSIDNGRITKYLWQFTDLTTNSIDGPYMNYTFKKKGMHSVSLTVFDQWNLSDIAEILIEVIDEQSPIAVAGYDAVIPIGTTLTFNGSDSTDDGSIVDYLWSFEYDGVEKKLGGMITQYKFIKAGFYNITLKVTDQSGNYGTDTLQVTVVGTGILKGTVIEKDGEPIKGAKITVKASDGKAYTGTSSANGSFSIVVPMGEATYMISCSGYGSVSGDVTIFPMQTTELDPSKTVLEKEPSSSILFFIIIAVVISLILIVLGVVVFALTRKKKIVEKKEIPMDDLIIEEELSGSVIQEPASETSPPMQENVPVTSNQEPVVSENLPPKNDMDELVSEMMKEMNENITPDEKATEEISK